jgi:hypothetical protein
MSLSVWDRGATALHLDAGHGMVRGETSPAIKGERALGADRSLVVLTHRFAGSTGLSNGSKGSEPGRSKSGLEKWLEEKVAGTALER